MRPRRRAASAFDRSPPCCRNPDPADDLDRLATGHHHLKLCRSKPAAVEPGQHLPAEAMAMDEQLHVDVVSATDEQR
jgi:hypothetical protein